jgi:hypothetical protein
LQNREVTSLQGFNAEAPHAGESKDILNETHFQKKTLKIGAKADFEVLPALTQRRALATP